jgi:hypothetical protein
MSLQENSQSLSAVSLSGPYRIPDKLPNKQRFSAYLVTASYAASRKQPFFFGRFLEEASGR